MFNSDFQNSLKIQKCDQQCRLIPGGYLLHASCVHKINTPYFFVINALSNLQDDPIYYNMTCDLDIRNARSACSKIKRFVSWVMVSLLLQYV